MLEPSIDSLLEKVHSKYALVIVSAKRAREMQEKQKFYVDNPKSKKFVGVALEEIKAEKIDADSHQYE
ncbi:DNA-directed RNA polymerase subunit omega [Salirhabdus salicampi]|uniref:DNA-directed RNA polymerase subunit omega n=1 Tax=Salirhabdus salicampi TaxID=476102 RepID=UPI0020C38AF0|nr:DNA-directed RNA polymerase subunit omega [Salirhabdus salicampi]MCP8616575.1 DNA-directed RNA polymerase subunit omega [Salirhabdus salicampi]